MIVKFCLGGIVGMATAAATIAVFAIIMDPLWLFGSSQVQSLNELKPAFVKYVRRVKPYLVTENQPKVLIFGASTSEAGYSPRHPGFVGKSGYNFALPGASSYETYRMVQHAIAVTSVEQAVLTVDFATFTIVQRLTSRDFSEEMLAVAPNGSSNGPQARASRWSVLLTKGYLADTLQTARQQDPNYCDPNVPVHAAHLYLDDGQRHPLSARRYAKCLGGNKFIFSRSLSRLSDALSRLPKDDPFIPFSDGTSRFAFLEKTLRLFYANNVNVLINFPPCHASYLEVIHRTVSEEALWEFKKRVIELNQSVARSMQKTPFPVWDFCNYNEYTTSRITDQNVDGFSDPQHFYPELGSLVLDRMLQPQERQRNATDGFGVRLDTENDLELFSAGQKAVRKRYLQQNPIEICWIEQC